MKLIIDLLTKQFDDKKVLNNVSFQFEKGKIYGLLGRNGAGKTTLFNCINVALLYLTNQQTEMFNLFILFLLINVLSVFFSVHWLAMYYLL